MKTLHIIIISLCVCMICHVNAQGQTITVGTDATNTSAILDLQSTQHGLLIPRMTGAERNAIKSPAEGLMIYNTSTDKLNIYTGSEGWYSLQAIQAGAATGSVAIGGGLSVNETGVDPHDVAIMDVSSTDKGFLLPRTQTADVGGAAESMLFFNTLSKRIRMYNGTEWKELLHQFESTTTADGTAGARGMLIANTGETEPHHSAMLELRSNNDEGLLIPRMTTAQRDALAPVQGLIVYNTETKKVNYCTGSHWMEVETEAEEFSGDGQPCVDLPEFEDTRNGYVYPTVQIGDQCWMAKNLAYLPVVHSNTQFETQSNNSQPGYGVYGYNGSDVATAKSQANYANYGVLYNWFAVNQSGVNAICPTGWHLPSDAEWTQLTNYVVSQGYPNSNVVNGTGNALKSCRQVNSPLGGACNTSVHPRWSSNVTHHGFDKFGFSAFSGGYRGTNGIFEYVGVNGYWWASTECSSASAWSHRMSRGSGNVHRGNLNNGSGLSVRCIKDGFSCEAPPAPTQGTHTPAETQIQWNWNSSAGADGYKYNTVNDYSTATDIGTSTTYTQEGLVCGTPYTLYVWAYNECGASDVLVLNESTSDCPWACGDNFTDTRDNNVYTTVQIGNQCWMAKNLAYLPSVVGPETGSETTPYYYVNGYNGTNVSLAKAQANYATYGVLYNWAAAMSSSASSTANPSGVQGICPVGWHLPSDAEWTELTDYLGGWQVAGGKLKNSGTTYWSSPNTGATNISGFTALPGGYRHYGYFDNICYVGSWWSATETYLIDNVWFRNMLYDYSYVNKSGNNKELGYSVRCLRD